jgi:hypothetical protein
MNVKLSVPIFFLSIILIWGCNKSNDSSDKIVISFKGGKVTGEEVYSKAKDQLDILKKREFEIRYRTAIQILFEKLKSFEKATGSISSEIKNSDNNESKYSQPLSEELKILFKKYQVDIKLKPE